jgi:hypothetical protein
LRISTGADAIDKGDLSRARAIVKWCPEYVEDINRERACEAAGVAPRYVDAGVNNDDEALKLVVSLNEHRRHMSLEQRAFAAARLANMVQGGDREAKSSTELYAAPVSLVCAAKLMNVSEMSANRARAIIAPKPHFSRFHLSISPF